MRLFGLGALGMDDTSVLEVGSVVKFTVSGGFCSGVYEKDIRDTLNNWASQMMNVVSVSTKLGGYVPGSVYVDVQAVVTNPITAGELRGQIIASLDALSQSVYATTCVGGVHLEHNDIQISSGGTGTGDNPIPSVPWSTTTVIVAGAAALLGVVILTRR